MRVGFDNEKYLKMQSAHIMERIEKFGDKLYLEFGGKLFDDFHASRVLPGFEPDSKLRMLMKLSDRAEIVIVINAADIEKNKKRADLGITYDEDVLRLRGEFQNLGFMVGSVVIKVNRLGTEGISSEGYSGMSTSYLDGLPANLRSIVYANSRIGSWGDDDESE